MIHIPQNPNEVLHNRLRGGSDKEVPANSWGFQTRMGSAKISKLVQIFVQKFLSCCHYWWEGNCPGTCSEQGVCRKCELSRFDKSSSFANPSGFCILKISKEWLHSKKSCITQKFHPLVTNKYIERQTVVHLTHYHSLTHSDENNIQQFHPPSSFPTFPMISWHSSTSTITYFMALGIATEAQYLSKSQLFQRSKYS